MDKRIDAKDELRKISHDLNGVSELLFMSQGFLQQEGNDSYYLLLISDLLEGYSETLEAIAEKL